MSKQYQYNEVPKKFDVTVYTHYCYHSDYPWQIGNVSHDCYERSGDNFICIAQKQVSISVPPQKVDIKQLVLEALEKEKQKLIAEHYKRLAGIQDKIDSLLCLEYKV